MVVMMLGWFLTYLSRPSGRSEGDGSDPPDVVEVGGGCLRRDPARPEDSDPRCFSVLS